MSDNELYEEVEKNTVVWLACVRDDNNVIHAHTEHSAVIAEYKTLFCHLLPTTDLRCCMRPEWTCF